MRCFMEVEEDVCYWRRSLKTMCVPSLPRPLVRRLEAPGDFSTCDHRPCVFPGLNGAILAGVLCRGHQTWGKEGPTGFLHVKEDRNAGLCSSSWLLVQKEDSRPSAQSQRCFPVNCVCQGGRPPPGTGVHTSRANACDCGVAAGGTVLGGLVAVQGCYFQIPALTSAAQKGKGQEL